METESLTESLVFGTKSPVTSDLDSLPLVERNCNEAVTTPELVTDAASRRTVDLDWFWIVKLLPKELLWRQNHSESLC